MRCHDVPEVLVPLALEVADHELRPPLQLLLLVEQIDDLRTVTDLI